MSRQLQTEMIKIKWFLDRTLLYPNTDDTTYFANKLFGILGRSLMLETSGIGKNEKSLLHSLFPHFIQKLNQSHVIYDYMMFIYKTAEFAPVWTTFLKIRAVFVHQTLTEHAF